MVTYSLAHIGINCENAEEAMEAAKLFETLFGFTVKPGNSSNFAASYVELNKAPGRGKHGHIAIFASDIYEAMDELKAKGFGFIEESARFRPDGTLNVIYLEQEICGFAIHLSNKA